MKIRLKALICAAILVGTGLLSIQVQASAYKYEWIDIGSTGINTPFIDVNTNYIYNEAINYMYSNGYISGDGAGRLHPKQYITYNELNIILGKKGINIDKATNDFVSSREFYRIILDAFGLSIGDSYIIDRESGVIYNNSSIYLTNSDGKLDGMANVLYTDAFPSGGYITRGEAINTIYLALNNKLIQEIPDIYTKMRLHIDNGYSSGVSEIEYYADMIPEQVWDEINNQGVVVIYGDINLDKYTAEHDSFVKGLYTMVDNAIYIRYPFVLLHEVGHWIYYHTDTNWVIKTCFEQERQAASELMRDYASINKIEFFADCFAYYISNKDNQIALDEFKAKLPLTYKLLVDLEQGNFVGKTTWEIDI